MIIIKCILFILIYLLLAYVQGTVIVNKTQYKDNSWSAAFVVGNIWMISSFYIVYLICYFTEQSLTLTTVLWCLLNLLLIIWGVKSHVKLLDRVNSKVIKCIDWLSLVVIFLVLFQVVFVSVFWHSDADDATYVATATSAYFTNDLRHFVPDTGMELASGGIYSYALAPFGVFWAMFGKLLVLHPTIIMHTLVPIVLIPLSYCVYYLIAKELFSEKSNQKIFMIFVNIINIFGYWSIRSTSAFFLLRIWQGKAVLCSIIIPLTIFLIMRGNKDNYLKNICPIMLMNSICACCVSGMGPILIIPLLGLFGIIDVIRNKRFSRCAVYLICIIPCILVEFVYYSISGI